MTNFFKTIGWRFEKHANLQVPITLFEKCIIINKTTKFSRKCYFAQQPCWRNYEREGHSYVIGIV